MNFDTDMYLQRDMIGQDSSVDRLGFVNPNITSEGANARLRGRANLGFSGPMGFVDIGIDDKKKYKRRRWFIYSLWYAYRRYSRKLLFSRKSF